MDPRFAEDLTLVDRVQHVASQEEALHTSYVSLRDQLLTQVQDHLSQPLSSLSSLLADHDDNENVVDASTNTSKPKPNLSVLESLRQCVHQKRQQLQQLQQQSSPTTTDDSISRILSSLSHRRETLRTEIAAADAEISYYRQSNRLVPGTATVATGSDGDDQRRRLSEAHRLRTRLASDLQQLSSASTNIDSVAIRLKRREASEATESLRVAESELSDLKMELQMQVVQQRIVSEGLTSSAVFFDVFDDLGNINTTDDIDQKLTTQQLARRYKRRYGKALLARAMSGGGRSGTTSRGGGVGADSEASTSSSSSSEDDPVRADCLSHLQRSFQFEIEDDDDENSSSSSFVADRIAACQVLGFRFLTAFEDDDEGRVASAAADEAEEDSRRRRRRKFLCGSGCIFEKDNSTGTASASHPFFEGLHLIYAGDLRFGARHGLGVSLFSSSNGKMTPKFFGQFRRGLPSGYGVLLSHQSGGGGGGSIRSSVHQGKSYRGFFSGGQLRERKKQKKKKKKKKKKKRGKSGGGSSSPDMNVGTDRATTVKWIQSMSDYAQAIQVLKQPGEVSDDDEEEVVLLAVTETVRIFRTPIGVFFSLNHNERVNVSRFEKFLSLLGRLHHPNVLMYRGLSRDPPGLLTNPMRDNLSAPISELLKAGKLRGVKVIHRVFLQTANAILALHLCASVPHGCLDWTLVWSDCEELRPENVTSFKIKLAYITIPAKSRPQLLPAGEKFPSMAADVFVFGQMMHEVLSHEEGEGEREETAAAAAAPEFPEWLVSIVRDAMADRIEDRPGMTEIVGRLTAGKGLAMVLPSSSLRVIPLAEEEEEEEEEEEGETK